MVSRIQETHSVCHPWLSILAIVLYLKGVCALGTCSGGDVARGCCTFNVRRPISAWLGKSLTFSSSSGPGGDGVNNALHDSVELARRIIKQGIDNLDAAVVEYEEAMFPRAVEAINKGQWAVQHLFSAESSQSFLRAAMQQ